MRGSFIAVALLTLAVSHRADSQPVERTWIIRGGTYSGDTVAIDPSAADRRGSRFWRFAKFRGDFRFVGWEQSRLPVAVAFHARVGADEADSAAFWAILRTMEADLGRRLFVPASIGNGDDPDDVVVVDVKPMGSSDGLTLVTWSGQGSLYDARVFFRSRSLLRSERVVTHEMMHALGFGHTSSWSSVMNPSLSFGPRLSREDVAYAQVALASRAGTELVDLGDRLALAATRERDYRLEYGQCDMITALVRSPGACTSFPCSAPSASCGEGQSTGPLPER